MLKKVIDNVSENKALTLRFLLIHQDTEPVLTLDEVAILEKLNNNLIASKPSNIIILYRLCYGLDIQKVSEIIGVNEEEIVAMEKLTPDALIHPDISKLLKLYKITIDQAVNYFVNEEVQRMLCTTKHIPKFNVMDEFWFNMRKC